MICIYVAAAGGCSESPLATAFQVELLLNVASESESQMAAAKLVTADILPTC